MHKNVEIIPLCPPTVGEMKHFCAFLKKNIFLDILDDSKNILENRFFDQTSS
jgi:hypothetical protein